jgi:ribosomal protein L37E
MSTKLIKYKFCQNCGKNAVKTNTLVCKKCQLNKSKVIKFFSYEFNPNHKTQTPDKGNQVLIFVYNY